ncbi:MAG: hypothetical protein LBR32_03035, partial [Propionibacteriaceae bacterium]|nr:hypothetical protein [Propionibacteriaceae bacterium]
MNAAAARTPLAFVAVAALFAGALASAPTNARASSGTDAVVAQLDQFNAAQLIDSYKVKYAVDGDNVAVAAVLTGMPGPNSLDIPAGVHVDWNLAAGASGLVFTGGGSVTFKANNYTGPKAGAAFVDSTGVSLKFDGWNISCGSSAAGTTAVKATGANVEWAAGTATCYDGIVVTGG